MGTHAQYDKWKFGALAALAVVFITSIPQLNLIIRRGHNWHGSYALIDFDELTYSAYLNGLISGRGRKNNPFSDLHEEASSRSENYYSIQFVPAYATLFFSRLLRFSASTTFILISPLMAFLSSLALFWLLRGVIADDKSSAIGVLIVLLCGRLVSESPLIGAQLYGAFAFLRRYVPAVPFPLFFIFCGCVWRALNTKGRRAYLWTLGAGILFGLLVYSYFFLWTAALAWTVSFGVLWLAVRPQERTQAAKKLSVVALMSICVLIPYFKLLTDRARTIDTDQALEVTRQPDLLRVSEIVGILIVLVLVWLAKKRYTSWQLPSFIFAFSSATLPIIVFNQQVLTGRSLQPFHYEQFIVNYVVLVGLVITFHLAGQHVKIRSELWMVCALTIGVVTAVKEANDNFALNTQLDNARPVFEQVDALSLQSGRKGFVLFNNSLLAAGAATSLSVPELWSPNMYSYGTASRSEQVERFHQYLYLLGVNSRSLGLDLRNSATTRVAVFGLPRVNQGLISKSVPISEREVDEEVGLYSRYVESFSEIDAKRWPLTYLITIDETSYDFGNLDRWYVRDAGIHLGGSIIYPLHFRNSDE